MLTRSPADITLGQVHAALGDRLLQGIHVSGPAAGGRRGRCSIQKAIVGALDDFMEEAEALLSARLERITLADLACRHSTSS